jgi:hypothetical protein
VLAEPGQVIRELRALDHGRTFSGYFDNVEKLAAAAAAKLLRTVEGVYVTLNPVTPALLARRTNRVALARPGEGTSDRDVLCRRWLPVDLDPVRPSGISSTDQEHAAALARAREVAQVLAAEGWSAPILADSGNGAHLLWRVDLPTDDDGLCKRVLEALAFRFDDETVTIDTTTHNPARICRLYGTTARKGDSTPERPHRVSRLVDVPAEPRPVSRELLEALAATLPTPPQPERRACAPFDLDDWIARHLPEGLRGPHPWNGTGRRWVFEVCPWNPAHTNRSAYLVQFPGGAVVAGCHHNSCQNKDWHALRDVVEPGWSDRRSPPAVQPEPQDGAGTPPAARLMTAAEILRAADDPDPAWLMDGLLPSGGLSVLAGRPKSGKSTLARALAVAVAQGRLFLGREVRQGAVLIVSLEDRKRDVGRHLQTLGLRPSDALLIATDGNIAQVDGWVKEHQPMLVVIDTIGRLLKIREVSEYGHVLQALDSSLTLARQSGAHFALLHHAGKGSDGRDAIDAPLGSTAFAGTADTLLHLKRAQDGTRTLATIQRVGDDLAESVIVIGADGWPAVAGTRREHQAQQMAGEILAYLNGRGEATRDEILAGVEGRAEAKTAALRLLEETGQVVREGSGKRGDPFRFRVSVPPFPRYTGNGGTEMENRPEPAPGLDESRSRKPGENVPVPATNTSEGQAPSGWQDAPFGPPPDEVCQAEEKSRTPPASPPDDRCFICKKARFWQSVYDSLHCATCRRPAFSELVRCWWVCRPSGKWLAIRPIHQTQGWKAVWAGEETCR